MFLSKLTLNPRSRRVASDMRNPYEMHRTTLGAFPNAADGGPGRVLFRLDAPRHMGLPVLLVQSEKAPDWRTLEDTDYLAEPAACKSYDPHFVPGQELVFRLRANPTVKTNGKRKGLVGKEARMAWLGRKAEQGGFEVGWAADIDEGYVSGIMGRKAARQRLQLLSVRFDGTLRVVAPELMLAAIRAGIGSAKAFGFGLLSVAPAR